MEEKDYLNFKILLEYYVSHLEWVTNNDTKHIGYLKYIEPLLKSKNFKITGQGYNGGNIQKQISSWDNFEGNQVCINISFNQRTRYQSKICYLNWIWTGINIIAEWNNKQIVGLYQELFIEKNKPEKSIWQSLQMSKSIQELGLFDSSNSVNSNLKSFYNNFRNALAQDQIKQQAKKQMVQIEKQIDLLEYKKQIILQGPPGTGKTRGAKHIVRTMISLTPEIIKNKITVGKIIPTAKGQVSYKVLSIASDKIILEREKGTTNETTIPQIIKTFNEEKWNNAISNNDDRMAVALAKYLYDDFFNENEQFKLIQFHPSYTYEDFVRGIVAKPTKNGNGILYEAENKILGQFAQDALKNYNASKNHSVDSNIDNWIDEKFEVFKNEIEAKLPEEETILSGDISIFEVSSNYFKYAKNWNTSGYIKFGEFKKLIKAIVKGELELSTKQLDKERFIHAHYRYTYYNSLLKIFFDQYNYKNETYSVAEKNYVLVIDEINRANLSSVLGELIYALEYRGEEVESMYEVDGSQKLILPANLYIIGTMNTADRSVGHIDYAIKRRFAFVDVLPKVLDDNHEIIFKRELFEKVSRLFITNFEEYRLNPKAKLQRAKTLSPEFRPEDIWLGHSYFIQKKEKDENGNDILVPQDFSVRLEYEIKPILQEYVKDGVLIGFVSDVEDGQKKEIPVEDYIHSLS